MRSIGLLLNLRFRHWQMEWLSLVTRLLFNPFMVVRSDPGRDL
jgi:hypothetical protein